MGSRRELVAFCLILAVLVAAFFHKTLFGGKVLSPADVLLVSASFHDPGQREVDYEPANRLLMDPVLQFQPWLEFNRRMIRSGRLPLWNGLAGCGAPHLANGQSAVFDPFHLIAYIGPTPDAYAWIAACRLWTAGLGMFLLARSWKLRFWGRWFAGLVYPFCGFLVLWLLYPVTSVAIWMPWLFLATDQVFRSGGARSIGCLALVVAVIVVAGHIQTSAHVLMSSAFYVVYRAWREGFRHRRALVAWVLGACLGLGLASVQILPLASYLAKSAVWVQRQRDREAWWVLKPPRLLDMVCTGVPYAYGSQCRGHPNLARAFGVHNLNESAAGFAGLATLIWLAPLAVLSRHRNWRVRFLAAITIFALLGAYRWPPVDNLLRALPVLNVTDNRRLTLWIAFGLTLLGGIGLDRLAHSRRLPCGWIGAWLAAAMVFGSSAWAIGRFEPILRERSIAHYRAAASSTEDADPTVYRQRAERQVGEALEFIPRCHGLASGELLALAALAASLRKRNRFHEWIQPLLLALTLAELAVVGFDLNPAIDRAVHEKVPPMITQLRSSLPRGGRVLGIGQELPPNVLMRFGLGDIRNYDSVELASSLRWFAALYPPGEKSPTSRSEITWERVWMARERLTESRVSAVVSATAPNTGAFEQVERVGQVWVARLAGKPWATCESPQTDLTAVRGDGFARFLIKSRTPERLVVRETWDPGWTALLDGAPAVLRPNCGIFMNIEIPKGEHELILRYDPAEVKLGLFASVAAAVLAILVLTGIRLFWIPGITKDGGLDGSEPPS
jgi:hypothetical protein